MNDELSGYDELADDQLHKAILDGDLDKVRSLMESGYDANVENFDGLVPLSTLARDSGAVEIAKILLKAGADPDGLKSLLPPLVMAASQNRRELVLLLLAAGADPNMVDEEEYTALMYSLINKDCELALHLLSLGASPRFVNRHRRDARYYAEEAGCQQVIARIDELLRHRNE